MHAGCINYDRCKNFRHLRLLFQEACALPGGGLADAHSYGLVVFDDDFVDVGVDKAFSTVFVYDLKESMKKYCL